MEKSSSLDQRANENFAVPPELLDAPPRDLPSNLRHAQWLSQAYFQSVHWQFPFLHEPTHMETVRKLYDGVDVGSACKFQVFMVLAIGATIRSRQAKVLLSAEGYCASAVAHMDSLFGRPSLFGVQCILLLQMYTISNPSSGLSIWTLHYHSLASILELGLQRNVQGSHLSVFEQEMRTRVFWCVYTVDRALSTLLGRQIGLMDEQCELRLPQDISDEDLKPDQHETNQIGKTLTDMSSAIHLFKLSKFNAEIKCILYCVGRLYAPYSQPVITDIENWQTNVLHRLRQWKSEIPRHPETSPRYYLNLICEVKYHELIMLLLRPSPHLQQPPESSLRECFSSALRCTRLYHRLYVTGMLHYSWISVHSLFLCVITMFYCVWAPNGVADEVDFDDLMRALKAASDVLSATGEYWPEAKRSRDVLDRISMTTMRPFTQRVNQDRPLFGLRAANEVPSVEGLERPADMVDMGLQPPSLAFDSGDAGITPAPFPLYEAPASAFVCTDLLSYFTDTWPDVNVNDAELLEEQYPSVDEVMQDLFFRDEVRNFERG